MHSLVESHILDADKLARFLFDYGGTLIPHGKPPGSEDLSRILDILTKLTADPRNAVYVISGRTKINIETDLGCIPGLGLRLVALFIACVEWDTNRTLTLVLKMDFISNPKEKNGNKCTITSILVGNLQ